METLDLKARAEAVANPLRDLLSDEGYKAAVALLHAFAIAVQQEEREACEKIAEKHGVYPELNVYGGGPDWYKHGQEIAAAIRQRGGGGMKPHHITLDEVVRGLTIRHLIAASHGEGSDKELYLYATFTGRGTTFVEYEVRHKRESVFVSAMVDVAIEKYNELP